MSLFFIAILPDQDVKEEINAIKKQIAENYECQYALNKITHITIQKPFRWPEEEVQYLKHELSTCFKDNYSFPVNLSGFGHFGDRVIYIEISNTEPLESLRSGLVNKLQDQLNFTDKMIGRRDFTPHITIANRDLSKTQFTKAWSNYKDMNINIKFTCKKVWLLKHDGKRWQPHHAFTLSER